MSHKKIKQNEFLDIPYSEHIVPFPNFGCVLLQHAREFPDKIALSFEEKNITYSQLLQFCVSAEIQENDEQKVKFNDAQSDLPSLLAMLYQGIPFELSFDGSGNRIGEVTINRLEKIDYFEPPYVKLDHKAFILNGEYEFSQYNVLVAAQAVGNAFKLFRDGGAYCPENIVGIEDLTFGILAPLYFAKSIYFVPIDDPDFFQYAWKGEIESNLRDAAMAGMDIDDHKNTYRLIESYNQTLGLGKVISYDGKAVPFLGFEIIDGEPRGHCLGKRIA